MVGYDGELWTLPSDNEVKGVTIFRVASVAVPVRWVEPRTGAGGWIMKVCLL